MPWVKIDDRAPQHPKLISVSLAARWYWLTSLCYAAQYLTNGLLTEQAAYSLGSTSLITRKQTKDCIAELLRVRLWEETDGGYVIHDYLDYNPSADATRQRRTADKERQRAWRERGGNRDNGVTNGATNDAPVPVPDPVPEGTIFLEKGTDVNNDQRTTEEDNPPLHSDRVHRAKQRGPSPEEASLLVTSLLTPDRRQWAENLGIPEGAQRWAMRIALDYAQPDRGDLESLWLAQCRKMADDNPVEAEQYTI